MRWSALVSLLCATAALTLSFLCLFAGSSRSFLQNGDLLTLNMSRLGYGVGEIFNTTDGDGGFLDNLVNDVQGSVNDLLNDATTEIASQLNLSDFYAVHVMNYCEGTWRPNGTAAALGENVSKNTTYCSPRNALFHFNVTEIVEDALPVELDLSSISWPEEITDAQDMIRTASIATVVLYILCVIFTGLALLGAVFVLFASGRLSACCNLIINLLASLATVIASVLATVVMVKAVNALNQYGEDLGISARRGNLFLGMTWTAAGLMLVATVVSTAQLVRGRKNDGYISEMRQKR